MRLKFRNRVLIAVAALPAVFFLGKSIATVANPTYVYNGGLSSSWEIVATDVEAEQQYFIVLQQDSAADRNSRCTRYFRDSYQNGPYVEGQFVNGKFNVGACGWDTSPYKDKIYQTVSSIKCGSMNDHGQCTTLANGYATRFNAGAPCAEKNSDGVLQCGDPINVSSGNKYETETDIVVAGSPLLTLTRTYNSQYAKATNGSFGKSWQSSFDYALAKTAAGFALSRPDGSVYSFTGLTPDVAVTPGSLDYVLDGNGNTVGYTFTGQDRVFETYDALGRITAIAYPEGQALALPLIHKNRWTNFLARPIFRNGSTKPDQENTV